MTKCKQLSETVSYLKVPYDNNFQFDMYTDTIKYLTVCPIYLIKSLFLRVWESTLKLQNSYVLYQYLLEIMGKRSQRDLVPKSLLAQVLQTFKVENRKTWLFYLVKMKPSKFKPWYFQNQRKFWTQTSWGLIPNIFKLIQQNWGIFSNINLLF